MSNRFAGLNVDDDEPEVKVSAQTGATNDKKSQNAPQQKSAPRKPPVGSAEAIALKRQQQEAAEQKRKEAQFSVAGNDGSSAPKSNKPRREKEGGRGPRREGGRGGARGGRGDKPRRDRHSNANVTESAKQLKQSWGGVDAKRELEAEEGAVADEKKQEAADSQEDANAADNAADEPKQLSLDEYLAQRAQNKLNLDLPQARTSAGDDEQWKGYVPVKKQEPEPYMVLGKKNAGEQAKKEKTQRSLRNSAADILVGFQPTSEPRQDRPRGERSAKNGRGNSTRGPRGSGRGNARGPRGGNAPRAQKTLDVSDKEAFPAL